jgi:uridine kinase
VPSPGRTVLPLPAVAARVEAAAPRAGSTRVVAIDGPAGSGKSTLAARLAPLVEAPVIHMDDLFPGWDGLAASGHLLRDWVLEPLSRKEPARYHRYDWHREAYADWVDVPSSRTLIVEGCGSGSLAGRRYLSMLIWVDAPQDVRMARGIARDGETFRPHWERWAAQEAELFAAERTAARADLRVDGNPAVPHDPTHDIVVDAE